MGGARVSFCDNADCRKAKREARSNETETDLMRVDYDSDNVLFAKPYPHV